MRLLVFSDIHNDLTALAKLMETEADYYVAAGDMVSWGRGLDAAGEILKRRGDRVYVLPGNHEWDSQIAGMCAKYALSDFHGKTFEAGGYHIAGLGYSSPTPFRTPGEYPESEIARRLKVFAALKPLILICHCPPRATTLDRVREGVHIGSQAIREFIERRQPEYFFCGHAHEGEGASEQLGKTHAANVGKRGYLLEV